MEREYILGKRKCKSKDLPTGLSMTHSSNPKKASVARTERGKETTSCLSHGPPYITGHFTLLTFIITFSNRIYLRDRNSDPEWQEKCTWDYTVVKPRFGHKQSDSMPIKINCAVFIQWNTTQQWKRTTTSHNYMNASHTFKARQRAYTQQILFTWNTRTSKLTDGVGHENKGCLVGKGNYWQRRSMRTPWRWKWPLSWSGCYTHM